MDGGIYGVKGLFQKVDKIRLKKVGKLPAGEIMNSEYFGESFYTPITKGQDRYLYRLEKNFLGDHLYKLFSMGENCKEVGIGDLKH